MSYRFNLELCFMFTLLFTEVIVKTTTTPIIMVAQLESQAGLFCSCSFHRFITETDHLGHLPDGVYYNVTVQQSRRHDINQSINQP